MTHQKPKRKLTVRHETIRALGAIELARAVGGGGAAPAFDTGALQCGTSAVAATVACGGG